MMKFLSQFIRRYEQAIFALKGWERILFLVCALLLTIGSIGILLSVNNRFTETVPGYGGHLKEGIVGIPRFINPILAFSDADRDLTQLVYSGLVRKTPEGFIPDLASSYEISEDGLAYTFYLRRDAVFHDNHPVTADDILFTIQKIQDPQIKSPVRIAWEGVTVEKVDTYTIIMRLKQPYAGFLQNATIGIIPHHIWENIPIEQFPFSPINIEPIGSGPYVIKKSITNRDGIHNRYILKSFRKFTLGKPYIKKITLFLFPNEQTKLIAYEKGMFDNILVSSYDFIPKERKIKKSQMHEIILPRTFGLFFNQTTQPIFTDARIIQAINEYLDKQLIIDRVLYGFGTPLYDLLPPPIQSSTTPQLSREEQKMKVGTLLDQAGWTLNTETGIRTKNNQKLILSIATNTSPELQATGEEIAKILKEIGIEVEIKVYETATLEQEIIRPRQFEVLLFGQTIRHDTDLFAFWHSSQRNDPGLNISQYTNTRVDNLLEKAFGESERSVRYELYKQFNQEASKDAKVVYLYALKQKYFTKKNLVNTIKENVINHPSERFTHVYLWHLHTERVWNFLAQ